VPHADAKNRQLAPLSTTDRRVGRVYVNQFTSRGYGLREAIKQAISPKSQRPQTASDLSQLLPAR